MAIVFFVLSGCGPSVTDHGTGRGSELGNMENVPTVSEFILGPGDELRISVYRHDDLTQEVRIGPSGKIMCPLAGDVQASGLSIFQVRDSIRDGLSRYIVNPQVSVSILSAQSQKIIVLGEVRSPGFFPSDMPMSLVEVVARAGGVTADAEQRNVLLIRGGMENPDVKVLNLEKVLKTGDLTENVVVRGGDIVYMPRSTIADVSKFFGYLSTIISPIVEGERAYLLGDEIRTGERGSVRTR
ncbi:MAG: polysaccharide biosynthesis/export family protein [Planctomycetota bacterium]|jgi:polysaccharide export outer membrane protein